MLQIAAPDLRALLNDLTGRGSAVVVELTAGPFELGRVFVGPRGPVHADVPGATGDRALHLLMSVTNCRANLRVVQVLPPATISPSLASLWPSSAAPTPTLAAVLEAGWRAQALNLTAVGSATSLLPGPASEPDDDGFDVCFQRGTHAYLHRDFAAAVRAFEACLALRPADHRTRHNLERIKMRMSELS